MRTYELREFMLRYVTLYYVVSSYVMLLFDFFIASPLLLEGPFGSRVR